MVRRSTKKATTNNYRCEFKNLKFKSKRRIAVVSRKARKDGEEQVSVRFTFGFLADVCEESWSLAHLREDSRTHRDNEKEREKEKEKDLIEMKRAQQKRLGYFGGVQMLMWQKLMVGCDGFGADTRISNR